MIYSENRFPLFRIMRYLDTTRAAKPALAA
jgi:hypothetical protein